MQSLSHFLRVSSLIAFVCLPNVGCGREDGEYREFTSAAHDGKQFVVCGSRVSFHDGSFDPGATRPVIMHSPDGRTFTLSTQSLADVPLKSVTFGNGTFVAVGGELFSAPGVSDFQESSTILFSADGATWKEASGIPTEALTGVAFGNGVFVAVGRSGGTYSSVDGATFSKGPVLTSSPFFQGIVFGAGVFVAYGEGNTAFVSPDGAAFMPVTIPTDVFSISFAKGQFHGSGRIGSAEDGGTVTFANLLSADGNTWMSTSNGIGATRIAELNGIFVGTTSSGVSRSLDGQSWKEVATFEENYRYDVLAAGGIFLVVGRDEIDVSTDGSKFTAVTLP